MTNDFDFTQLDYADLLAALRKDLALDQASLDPALLQQLTQPGFIVGWKASLDVPLGFLRTNGTTVSRTLFDSLYRAIGTAYGVGDGSTTFTLPTISDSIIKT